MTPGELEVTSTVFVEAENYDQGSCIRTEGFHRCSIEFDCFFKSGTRSRNGKGQTTYFTSQTGTSSHSSNSINQCNPTTERGIATIELRGSHTSTINLNNFTDNGLYYAYLWDWDGVKGSGEMNTIADNAVGYILWSNVAGNSLSKSNLIGNKRTPLYDDGLFYINSEGTLSVSECIFIENTVTVFKDGSGSLTIDGCLFFRNSFSTGIEATSRPFTYTLTHNQDWECLTNPVIPTNPFSKRDAVKSFLFFHVFIGE